MSHVIDNSVKYFLDLMGGVTATQNATNDQPSQKTSENTAREIGESLVKNLENPELFKPEYAANLLFGIKSKLKQLGAAIESGKSTNPFWKQVTRLLPLLEMSAEQQ